MHDVRAASSSDRSFAETEAGAWRHVLDRIAAAGALAGSLGLICWIVTSGGFSRVAT